MLANTEEKTNDYLKAGQSWNEEIHASLRASKNKAWLITAFCMGVALLSLLALIIMLPLKTIEPYVLTVDRNTGYVEVTKGLYQDGALHEDEAITQSNLVRYVSTRESYNPAILRENYDFVVLMSGDDALQEFKALWAAQNPDNPSVKFGKDTAIDIKIKSVSLLNSKTASVRFMREQYESGQIKTSHWSAIIEFQYAEKPMKMADRFSNPLGFQVTHYRIAPEGSEHIK